MRISIGEIRKDGAATFEIDTATGWIATPVFMAHVYYALSGGSQAGFQYTGPRSLFAWLGPVELVADLREP